MVNGHIEFGHPAVATLASVHDGRLETFCSASFVGCRDFAGESVGYAVTAAHCAPRPSKAGQVEDFLVVAPYVTYTGAPRFRVAEWVVHPDYTRVEYRVGTSPEGELETGEATMYNDIAMVRLDGCPSDVVADLEPIALPSPEMTRQGREAFIAGYGVTNHIYRCLEREVPDHCDDPDRVLSEDEEAHCEAQSMKCLPDSCADYYRLCDEEDEEPTAECTVATDACHTDYANDGLGIKRSGWTSIEGLYPFQLWTTGPVHTNRGDSGGPLLGFDGGRAHLLGVTSWGGYDDEGQPSYSVYERVDVHTDFLLQVLRGERPVAAVASPCTPRVGEALVACTWPEPRLGCGFADRGSPSSWDCLPDGTCDGRCGFFDADCALEPAHCEGLFDAVPAEDEPTSPPGDGG